MRMLGMHLAVATLLVSGVATAFAEEPPAASHILKLHDTNQAATELGRMRLKYLVSCALPADTVVEVQVDQQAYRFPGSLALAPEWSKRGLTTEEERLVSSCILARTNYFGIPVILSMRGAADNASPALRASPEEQRSHTYFEGAFFGNVFQADSPAYVCLGATPDANRTRVLESLKRVCSLPPGGPASGEVSRCGFLIVGDCAAHSFVQNGVDYSQQAVNVFLALPASP